MKLAHCLLSLGWAMGLLATMGCGSSSTSNKSVAAVFSNVTLEQGLQMAKADNKLVMVDFYADWCGPCKMLDAKTWSDATVQTWLQDKTVPLKINVDKAPELAGQYKIQGIPALVFIAPDGAEVGRLVGFHEPSQFLKKAGDLVGARKVPSE